MDLNVTLVLRFSACYLVALRLLLYLTNATVLQTQAEAAPVCVLRVWTGAYISVYNAIVAVYTLSLLYCCRASQETAHHTHANLRLMLCQVTQALQPILRRNVICRCSDSYRTPQVTLKSASSAVRPV